jgi:arabinofuranan 3-O-arabinosyltransferase
MSLTSGGTASSPSGPGTGRALRVVAWAGDSRSLRVTAGPRSYLELHQNANPGWAAALNGRPLTPVTLDGWQQGYVLPAGRGGLVTLTFGPDRLYHVILVTAALAALALLPLALVPLRRRRALLSEPEAARPAGAARWTWARLAALTGLILVAGGPVALVVPALAALAWWRPRWRPAVAAAGMLAAGGIAATASTPAMFGTGAFSAAAQACALIALAAALMPAISGPGERRRPGASDPG